MRVLLASALVALFVSELDSQITKRISLDWMGNEAQSGGSGPSLSNNGRYAAFASTDNNIVPGDTDTGSDIFLRDLATGIVSLETVNPAGVQIDGADFQPRITPDGSHIVWATYTRYQPRDGDFDIDIYLRHRVTSSIILMSIATNGRSANDDCSSPTISSDAQRVAFQSAATDLAANDTNGHSDIFVRDRPSRTTTRISNAWDGSESNGDSYYASISGNGQLVAFVSDASNLVSDDSNGYRDVFLHDLQSRTTIRVSCDPSGADSNGDSGYAQLSADGLWIAFESQAFNLVNGDTNGVADVFLHDIQSLVTTRVSVASDGTEGNGDSLYPYISATGRWIGFTSDATNLVGRDLNDRCDVFVHDSNSGTTSRKSVDTFGIEGNGNSAATSLSGDGRFVGFHSFSDNLVPGDTNGVWDTFVHGPALNLDIQPDTVSLGSTLTFTTWSGTAADPVLLFVTEFDGNPFPFKVAHGNLGPTGHWSLSMVVPPDPGLLGRRMTLQSYSLDPLTRKVEPTNPQTVSFQ